MLKTERHTNLRTFVSTKQYFETFEMVPEWRVIRCSHEVYHSTSVRQRKRWIRG